MTVFRNPARPTSAQDSARRSAQHHTQLDRERIRTIANERLPLAHDSATNGIVASQRSERAARILNVTIAAGALVLLSPVIVAVAVAIKLTSPGPIFYRQTRIGVDRRRRKGMAALYDRRTRDLGGTPFAIYKLRSMRADAERSTGAVWAAKGDPRVTPIGRLIRKTRLDELPQLLNVIKGDMNIVGPRPERPSIFADLSKSIEEYPVRQLARPGITGWAQVNRSYDSCLDDVRLKVQYDLEYIQRQSVLEDLKIMIKTVPVVFGAEKGW